MVTILFVNTYEELGDYKHTEEISFIIKSYANKYKVCEDDFFLMTTKGKICSINTLVKENIEGNKKYLLLFQKGFINTEMFVYSKNWTEFNKYPMIDTERFDFSEFVVEDDESQNNEFDVIRTNEEILFQATQKARCIFAKFFTNNKIIRKNCLHLKYKKMIAKGLLLMVEEYDAVFQRDFKRLNENVMDLKNEVIKLKKVQGLHGPQNTSGQITHLFNKYTRILEKLDNNLSKLKKKFISNLNDELEKQNHNLLKLKNIRKTILEKVENYFNKSDNSEITVQLNMRVCFKFEKFQNKIRLLTDESYHPKTPIVDKLKKPDKVLSLFEDINNSSSIIDVSKELIESINLNFEKVNNIYKNITEFTGIFTQRLNYKAKVKLESYKKKTLIVKEALSSILKLEQIPNFEEQIKKFKERENAYNDRYLSKILDELKQEKAKQTDFIRKYGNSLPAHCFQSYFKTLNLKNIGEFKSRSIQNRNLPELNLTNSEISEFYRIQISSIEDQIKAGISQKTQDIINIEHEILNLSEEIDEIENLSKSHQQLMQNSVEEIGILNDKSYNVENLGKTGLLKLEYLRYRDRIYTKEKMQLIHALRKLSIDQQNPFNTPR